MVPASFASAEQLPQARVHRTLRRDSNFCLRGKRLIVYWFALIAGFQSVLGATDSLVVKLAEPLLQPLNPTE
ncbi:MAG: hypothetical protein CBB71_00585 [Rhodopirellula sp. TMED11]|nr:MAG: hypothetical protein CBB71_00585 [Rhodopirellula sp. TMED11]